jgi:hypothetical protein
VPEYNSAAELLGTLEGGLAAHRRRAAELDFKRANALQLSDKPGEALAAIRNAKAHLQVRTGCRGSTEHSVQWMGCTVLFMLATCVCEPVAHLPACCAHATDANTRSYL